MQEGRRWRGEGKGRSRERKEEEGVYFILGIGK
jgi:hypothetical protein